MLALLLIRHDQMASSEQENGNYSPTVDVKEINEAQELDISVEKPGTLFQVPSSNSSLSPEEIADKADKFLGFLGDFPEQLTAAYGEYQKPITTLGLLLIAALTIAVADGILDRLNTIPFFAPVFELIGLGFSGWFIFRYLIYAESRQELKQEVDVFKSRIVGSMKQLEEMKD